MESLVYVLVWVLPSVLVALGVGYYLGRSGRPEAEPVNVDGETVERTQVLRMLSRLTTSAEKLTNDVDTHNHQLEDVERSLGAIQTTGELADAQTLLMSQIARVLDSNRDLENDLICTKYKLQQQALELDRTRKEARTDMLSGVGNRKAFEEHLQFLLSQFRTEGKSFVLVLLDVDKFKWINDTHGHQAGDHVVRQLGNLLHECVRESDFVARYGGDEFAILFAEVDEVTATQVTDRIRMILERHPFDCGLAGERLSTTCSIGLAGVRLGDSKESLTARADQALYKSKRSGRNQVNVGADVVAPVEHSSPV